MELRDSNTDANDSILPVQLTSLVVQACYRFAQHEISFHEISSNEIYLGMV